MADEPQKKKREGEVTLPKKKKKRMKDSGEESLTLDWLGIKPEKKMIVNFVPVSKVHRLYVDNIPKDKTKNELVEEFSKNFDGLNEVIICTDPENPSNQNKGFAFLEFDRKKSAVNARRKLRRVLIFEAKVSVFWAEPEDAPDEKVMPEMNPARCTVTTKCLASEVAEDMETLSERIAALEKEYRKEQKKNRNEIEQLRKEIKKIKEENEKKEECQRFTFILKDLSVYKSIVEKIEKITSLDHHEKRVVKLHLNEKNGIKNDKRTGVWAYFDVKNGVGHSMLTETSVEECLNLFLKYPDMATYFDVECTYEETIDFLKSCEGCVEAVKELAETEGTEREQLLLVLLGKKKTQADINSKRNERRKKSTKQKNKMQPNKMQPNKKQPNKKQPNKKQPNKKQPNKQQAAEYEAAE